MDFVDYLGYAIIAALLGYLVISQVPAQFHTPLMSATNAIHGLVLIGVVVIAHEARDPFEYVLVGLAGTFASINVFGGFSVTGRMLAMFRPTPEATPARAKEVK